MADLIDRKEWPRVYTPRFTAIYPALNEPDTKFKAEGEFKVRCRFHADDPAWAELRELAEGLIERAYEAKCEELRRDKKAGLIKDIVKAPAFRPEVDEAETGEETGYLFFSASRKHEITPKTGKFAGKTLRFYVDIFNAAAKQLKNPPKIGNGSEMIANVTIKPYFIPKDKTVGVSYELNAVQLLKVVEGGAHTADFYGFAATDGDDIDDGTGGFTAQSGQTVDDEDADF